MADDFHLGTGNWWDSARNRAQITGTAPPPSVSTRLNAAGASFEWPPPESRSPMDSGTASGGSVVLQDHSPGGALADPSLQLMGLGLSSHGMDWNQALFRGEKSEGSFRSILQDDMSPNSSSFQQESSTTAISSQEHWRHKLYGGAGASSEDTSAVDSSNAGYQVDSAAAYGFLMSENQLQHHSNYENRTITNYAYPSSGYGPNSGELMQSWNKFPQFLRTAAPLMKPPQPPPPPPAVRGSHLQFSNNTPFWNASGAVNDARSGFFAALPTQIPFAPSFDEKPKSGSEARDVGTTTRKNTTESSNKRTRNEAPSSLPACNNKVKKEKMGDRITALQQLVSPFGKTDTASVLSEAIECIKFLHEQVGVLSTPYMKIGSASLQQQHQSSSKSKDAEGPRQDLRTRGLCLVPVSSTFPVTQETTQDFWSTPTFGGTFR